MRGSTVIVIAMVFLIGILILRPKPSGNVAPGGATIGAPAPEIQVKEWLNTTESLTLASLNKKIVVVEFWATWCPPCRTSIPHLVDMHNKYKDKGVVILGLTDEPKAKVERFATEMKMSYPVGLGSSSGSSYGVQGIPHAFVVVPGGTIAWSGHPMDGLDAAIEKALIQSPPQN